MSASLSNPGASKLFRQYGTTSEKCRSLHRSLAFLRRVAYIDSAQREDPRDEFMGLLLEAVSKGIVTFSLGDRWTLFGRFCL